MMIGLASMVIEGIAGKLSAIGQKVVSSGFLGLDSGLGAGRCDDLQVAVDIKILLLAKEGEIEVA